MLHPPCLSWRWWAPLLIVIVFETRVCAQTVVYQDWRSDDTMDVGSGWKHSSWFGYFYDESFPWIYHETQGWLYSESVSSESVWFWDQNIGWIWTSDESYPYLFISETSAWVTDLGDVRLTEKEETAKTLDTLVSENSDAARALIDEIVGHKDIRYIAVFIELMRAQEVFIQVAIDRTIIIDTLEALSGENFGSNWAAWVEWYGLTDLALPSGFTSWKGRLLSNIDPEFGDFLNDDFPSRIRTEEILWGACLLMASLLLIIRKGYWLKRQLTWNPRTSFSGSLLTVTPALILYVLWTGTKWPMKSLAACPFLLLTTRSVEPLSRMMAV